MAPFGSSALDPFFRMIPVPARLILAAVLLAAVSAARAQPAPATAVPRPTAEAVRAAMLNNPDEIQQSFTLADVDLGAALEALENLTGRTILRPQMLPTATITIKINQPMAKSDVVLALETVLSLNQIGVVPMGDEVPQGGAPHPDQGGGAGIHRREHAGHSAERQDRHQALPARLPAGQRGLPKRPPGGRARQPPDAGRRRRRGGAGPGQRGPGHRHRRQPAAPGGPPEGGRPAPDFELCPEVLRRAQPAGGRCGDEDEGAAHGRDPAPDRHRHDLPGRRADEPDCRHHRPPRDPLLRRPDRQARRQVRPEHPDRRDLPQACRCQGHADSSFHGDQRADRRDPKGRQPGGASGAGHRRRRPRPGPALRRHADPRPAGPAADRADARDRRAIGAPERAPPEPTPANSRAWPRSWPTSAATRSSSPARSRT